MNEQLTAISKLNDLRARVLAGEEVSPEEYREVIIVCRRLRRDAGASEEKKEKKSRTAVDVDALLNGVIPAKKNAQTNPLDDM